MVSVSGASFVHSMTDSQQAVKPYPEQQADQTTDMQNQQMNTNLQNQQMNANLQNQQMNANLQNQQMDGNMQSQQMNMSSGLTDQLAEQLAALLLSQQANNSTNMMSPQTIGGVSTMFGQSNVNVGNLLGGQQNTNAGSSLLSQSSAELVSLLQQLSQQAGGSGNQLTSAGNAANMMGQVDNNTNANTGAVWPDLTDPKLFSLFASTTSTGQTELPDLSMFTSSAQQTNTQVGQNANQWSTPSKEPSQATLLAALQSIQLKLQVQEQAVEYQNLEKQNQLLITSLLNAQQRIQELQAEVALLQLALEKIDSAARMAEQEQRMREQVLQQRHAQLTASNMEAEMAIQQMEASLADVRHLQKDLNYSNIVLALSYPNGTAPENMGAAAGVPAAMPGSAPATPARVGAYAGTASAPATPAPESAANAVALPSPGGSISGRSGAQSYANRKCYNCGQKGHRAGDCPNPRTRPDTDGANVDGEASGLASPGKIPATPEGSFLAPATPDMGVGSVVVSRMPPVAPLAQPSPVTLTPIKDATPRAMPRRAAGDLKSATPDTKAVRPKANGGRLEHKPRPPMLNASPGASPMLKKAQQPPLTPTMVTPPLTPNTMWKGQIGVSPLPPLTPSAVGNGYTRPAGRQNVARCIPWQN